MEATSLATHPTRGTVVVADRRLAARCEVVREAPLAVFRRDFVPLVAAPPLLGDGFLWQLSQQFLALAPATQRRVLALVGDVRCATAAAVRAQLADCGGGVDAELLVKVAMVCEYNAYTEEGSQEVALFAYLGKFSHSCRPNCFRFHEDGNVVVRTLVPVDPGEELTVDYDSIRSQTMPIGVRREYLLRSKGFECLCPRCSAPADDTRSFYCCSNSPSSRSFCSGAHQASTLVPNLFTLTSCNLCGLVPTLLQTQSVLSAETLLPQQVAFLNEQAQNGGEVYEINALIDQMKSPHPHHFYASEYWAVKGRQAQEFNDMKEVTRKMHYSNKYFNDNNKDIIYFANSLY